MPSSAKASQAASKAPAKAKAVSPTSAAKTPAPAAKTAKPAAKRKPAAQAASKKVAAKPVKPAKPPEAKKPKLVRDSFTMPQADHDLIKHCKKAALATGRETKKSEVIRAAIQSFAALPTSQQMAAYGKLQAIAVGRPKAK